jgi:hypothetical protein
MVQTMLASVADGQGNPYYAGEADGIKGSETKDAVKRFQGDAGLSADGDPGPQTRRALFGVYMDWLCTPASAYAQPNDPNQAAPSPLHMQSADFLGGAGAQPGDLPQMSLQSCGKFNPVVLLEKSEMNETDKTERNEDDAPNRRVVMFFFAKGTTIDPAGWPCPKVKDENNACKAAFWPDGDQRRQNGDARRTYQRAHDTMACRFYDRWARRSPCEGGLARQSADFFVYPAAQDGSSAGSQLEASWGDALRLGWLIGGSVQTLTISNDAVGASADVTGYSQTKGGYTVGNVPVVVPPDAVEVGTATYKLAVNRATGSVNLRVHVRISGVAPDPPTWALAPLVGVDEADDLGLGAPEPICPWPCSPDEGDGDS